jgi:hypothetical protein
VGIDQEGGEDMGLSFGYNAGLPEGVRSAWGARLIVGQDGYVDLVHNRTDFFPEGDWTELREWLNGGVLRKALDTLSDKLKAYEVRTREAAEVTLYEDAYGKVVGNTNASHGYFYVAAYLIADFGHYDGPQPPERPDWVIAREQYLEGP